MNRLTVHKIVSIGAVESGDNPEAQIMFWKSAPDAPSGREGTAPVVSPAAKGRAMGLAVMKRLDAQGREIQQNLDDYETIATEIRKLKGTRMVERESRTVRAQVDALARELVEKGEAENLTAARPMIWRKRPDLVAKSRQETTHPVDEGSGKTITDRVREVIDEAAAEASMGPLMENWGPSHSRQEIISKVRAEMWHTPDGQMLRHLDRTVGSKPYTTASVTAIRKSHNSDKFRKALKILDHGLQLPS